MIPKHILVPQRLRRPPATGWSWVDRRFLREHGDQLSRDAILLYLFLAAVADRHGLSFYSDNTLSNLIFDNLKPAVLNGSGRSACFHPEFLALCGYFCLQPVAGPGQTLRADRSAGRHRPRRGTGNLRCRLCGELAAGPAPPPATSHADAAHSQTP